ncbi:hypothetical protein JCM33374_g846 [Metschnikowia sp. JCM 33374]|nr:hypothetical protein JCM33374_g846 [Metschnikowia sp. JCM 33374]
MSDLPELDMLVDAFPNYPRSELASRLLCASSPEVLFNELLVEAANEPEHALAASSAKVFHPHVNRLKELFPTAQKDNLADALHRNNGCLDKTIEHMLENNPVHNLVSLCGLDDAEAAPYMARNKNDVLRALADVISHYKKRKKVRTSRIQAPNNPSVAYRDSYVLHEHSTELLQLKECIWAESALQELNYDFLLKSLVFFQGNVSRVLDVSRVYIEAGCQSVTFDHRLGFQVKEVPKPSTSASTLLRSKSPSLISPRPLGPKLGAASSRTSPPIREKSPLAFGVGVKTSLVNTSRSKPSIHLAQPNLPKPAPAKPAPHIKPNGLDLHGCTVVESVNIVKEAVSAWWKEEKDARMVEGHIDRYGARAEFVDPLRIITGRGIHSAGGASKIRVSVIRLLSQEGYLIDEYVGSVAVYGRKPRKH